MTGSLAPPPPYGSEAGSILLETGRKDSYTGSQRGPSVQTYFRPQHQQGLEPGHGHGRTRSGNFRVLSPTSPGPARSPTDISLAQLVPNDDGGEPSTAAATAGSGVPAGTNTTPPHPSIGLGLQEPNHPPPEYTSPASSDAGSRRNSSDSEHAPLIRVSRSRGTSSVTIGSGRGSRGRRNTTDVDPPIPSYSDAVRQGAGRDRSDSARSAR